MDVKPGSDGDLQLGLAEVDREHDLQISLLDELAKAPDAAGAARIAQELRDATEAHFIGEEVLMRQHSYPLYHAHVEEHARLLSQLEALRSAHQRGESQPQEHLAALREWLRTHVRGMDRDFATFANSPGSAAGSTR